MQEDCEGRVCHARWACMSGEKEGKGQHVLKSDWCISFFNITPFVSSITKENGMVNINGAPFGSISPPKKIQTTPIHVRINQQSTFHQLLSIMSSNTHQTRSNSASCHAGEDQVGQQVHTEEAVWHVAACDQEHCIGMSVVIAASTADFRAAVDSVVAAVVASS